MDKVFKRTIEEISKSSINQYYFFICINIYDQFYSFVYIFFHNSIDRPTIKSTAVK